MRGHVKILVLAGLFCLAGVYCRTNEPAKSNSGGNAQPGGISVLRDSSWETHSYTPLDEKDKALAADGERAFLLCINREAKGLPGADLSPDPDSPLYVITDQTFELPTKRPPEFRLAKDGDELERIARETGKDVYGVRMETLGMGTLPGGAKGVVILYGFGVIDWERAAWKALSETRKQARPVPKFRQWLCGGGVTVCVTRGTNGQGLVFHMGQLVVS